MFGQPYFVGPYVGATVAAMFWMCVNYVRYNYDDNYKRLDECDRGRHDGSRDVDEKSRDHDLANDVHDDQRE